jgi:hypothetical protein
VSWTDPGGDFSNVVVLRNTVTIPDVPVEGSSPAIDSPNGTSVVRYIANGTSFVDTGLTNGTPYFYRIFAKDTNGNYAATGVEVSATPDSGPIAHWNFDTGTGLTAFDSVGTNHGTLTNGPTWACVAGGGYALDFDGTDDYVGVGIVSAGVRTVSFWTKADATTKKIMDLDGTVNIEVSAGEITVNGLGSGAIAYDATSNSGVQEGSSNFTWNHVMGSGANRILIVGVGSRDVDTIDNVVLDVTYDGVSMTPLRADVNNSVSLKFIRTELWYKLDPVSGTKPITVTLTGASEQWGAGAVSFSGVDQNNPIDAHDGKASTGSPDPNISITTVADNAWLVDTMYSLADSGPHTADAPQDQRWSICFASCPSASSSDGTGGSTKGPVSPPGATTMSWFIGEGSSPDVMSALSLKPAPAGTSTIYVDGSLGSTIDTNWHHVVITTGSDVNANAVDIGRISTGYFDGQIDDVRLYDRVLSAAEITALAASPPTACAATTTIADGTDPGNTTIAPGGAITDLDAFTLVASTGTDTVTAATVTLGPAGAFNNIGQADITNTSNVAQCTAIPNPVSNTLSFTGCTIPVTTTVTTFKVRITPKTHATCHHASCSWCKLRRHRDGHRVHQHQHPSRDRHGQRHSHH